MTLNMLRAFADQPNISASTESHTISSFNYPLAPCDTLIVMHNSIRETWDNFGHTLPWARVITLSILPMPLVTLAGITGYYVIPV